MLTHLARKLPRVTSVPSRHFFKMSPAQEEKCAEFIVGGIFVVGFATVFCAVSIMIKEFSGKGIKKEYSSLKSDPDCALMLKILLDMNKKNESANTQPKNIDAAGDNSQASPDIKRCR